MESTQLIQRVNQTAALEIPSLRFAYRQNGFDIRRTQPIVDLVVTRLRRFAEQSQAQLQHAPAGPHIPNGLTPVSG